MWRWAALLLAASEAGWMAFDGAHALLAGDYVAPGGRLGPWSLVVSAAGIDPRATGVMVFFAAYGLAWLALTALYARGRPLRRWMLGAAAGSLWYLPVGTLFGLAQMALLWRDRR